ncbi:MAG: hypothetical protein AB1758_05155 [Candidatus Eremiobacterota bacterium]
MLGPMQIQPAVRGKLTKITEGQVGAPRLSGDGKTVVWNEWVDGQWEVMRYKDGKILCLSKDAAHDISPQVSHDGDVVVWSRFNQERGDWDVYQWRNGTVTPVADSPADEMSPAVSADGRTIVWTHDDISQPIGFDIYKWREGEGVEQVTSGGPVDTDPFVNADGSWIFFRRKVQFDGGDLWMRDHQGVCKPITHTTTAEFTPTATYDGMKIAWSQADKDDHDIYLFECEGSYLTPIAAQRGVDERDPVMTSDGQTMAWSESSPGSLSQIVIRENGQKQQITAEGSNAWPQLSADGRTMAWQHYDPDTRAVALYHFERDA